MKDQLQALSSTQLSRLEQLESKLSTELNQLQGLMQIELQQFLEETRILFRKLKNNSNTTSPKEAREQIMNLAKTLPLDKDNLIQQTMFLEPNRQANKHLQAILNLDKPSPSR